MKLNIPHGGYLPGLRMYSSASNSSPVRICGPAHTIRMVPASDVSSPTPKIHFADSIAPGSVVFVSQPKGLISACWGGLMSTRAKKLGAEGVVIDGRFRDIMEHRKLNLGLFARDVSILGSNTFTRSSELGVPVEYTIDEIEEAKVVVNPGDIIVGDADGVVAIPTSAISKCIELCEERWEIDQKTLKCLENGDEMGLTIKSWRT